MEQERAEHERFTEPVADRPPTEEEARAADEAAADVDLDHVRDHYEEMADHGAHLRGEGEIEPPPG